MTSANQTMAQRVAQAALESQQQRNVHLPEGVTAVFGEDTLVITLHAALTPAEKELARSAEGAAQVQDFHRRLFESSVDPLRQEIKRITGIAVREAAVEVEPSTGAVIHAFTSGTVVQIFQLAGVIPVQSWGAPAPAGN